MRTDGGESMSETNLSSVRCRKVLVEYEGLEESLTIYGYLTSSKAYQETTFYGKLIIDGKAVRRSIPFVNCWPLDNGTSS